MVQQNQSTPGNRSRFFNLLIGMAVAAFLLFLPDLIRPYNPETAERARQIIDTGFLVLSIAALALILIVFFAFRWRRRQARAQLPQQLVDISEAMIRESHLYRSVKPEEYPLTDLNFYRQTQTAFELLGFHWSGDAVDAGLEETPLKPEAFNRYLLSLDSTRLVGFAKLKPKYFLDCPPLIEMTVESEDGRFFIISATKTVDYFPKPPEIYQTFLPPDTKPEAIKEAFERDLAAFMKEHPDFVPKRFENFAAVLASLERLDLCYSRYRIREGFFTANDYAAAKAAGVDEASLDLFFTSYHQENARRARERGETNVNDGTTRPWLPSSEEDAPSASTDTPKQPPDYQTLAFALITGVLMLGIALFATTVPYWLLTAFIRPLQPLQAHRLQTEEVAAETLVATLPEDDSLLFHQPSQIADGIRWQQFAERHKDDSAYTWWSFWQSASAWFDSPNGHDILLWHPNNAADQEISRHPALNEIVPVADEPVAAIMELMQSDPDNGGAALLAAIGLMRSGMAMVEMNFPDPKDSENRKTGQRFVVLNPAETRDSVRWISRAVKAPRIDFNLDKLQRERLRALGHPDSWSSVTMMGNLLNRNIMPDDYFWEDFVWRSVGLAATRLEIPDDDLFDPIFTKAETTGLLPTPPTEPTPSQLYRALPDTENAVIADDWSAYEILQTLQTIGAHIIRDNTNPEAQRAGLLLVFETSNCGALLLSSAGRDAEAAALLARGVNLVRPEVVERLSFILAQRKIFQITPDSQREMEDIISIDKPILLADTTVQMEAKAMVAAEADSWSRSINWQCNRYWASFSPTPNLSSYGPIVEPVSNAPMRQLDIYSGQLLFWYIGLIAGWLWLALETGFYFLCSRSSRRYPTMTKMLQIAPWASPRHLLFVAGAVVALGLGVPTLALHMSGVPTTAFGLGGIGTPNIIWGSWLSLWSLIGIASIVLLLSWLTWRQSLQHGDHLLVYCKIDADKSIQRKRRRYIVGTVLLCGLGLYSICAWYRYSWSAPETGAGLWTAVFVAAFLLLMGTMFCVLADTEFVQRPYTVYRLCRQRFLLPALATALGVWMLAYPYFTAQQRMCIAQDTIILPRPDDAIITFPRYTGLTSERLRSYVSDVLAKEDNLSSDNT